MNTYRLVYGRNQYIQLSSKIFKLMQASSGQLIDNTQYLTSSWKFTQRYSSFILGMGWVLNFMWTKEKIVKSHKLWTVCTSSQDILVEHFWTLNCINVWQLLDTPHLDNFDFLKKSAAAFRSNTIISYQKSYGTFNNNKKNVPELKYQSMAM